MSQTQSRFELKLELIMQRALASAVFAGLLALPLAASADDAPTAPAAPDAHARAAAPKASAAAKPPAASAHADSQSVVAPVAITAKRTHPRLDLRLSSDRLNRVLDDSGVEPVAEADPAIDAIEVTARRVQDEPITPGIPAIYYGITHPTEAWRIFAPIQP